MTTRWFVEVSRVDADTQKERYCVEALQWQQALQQARKLRGDRGALSRFAIELLDSGYRATDPAARLRYTISKAPVDATLSADPPTNGATKSSTSTSTASGSSPGASAKSPSQPPRYDLPKPPGYVQRPGSSPPKAAASTALNTSSKPAPTSGPLYEVPRRNSSNSIQTSPAVPKPRRSQRPPKVTVKKSDSAAPPNKSVAPSTAKAEPPAPPAPSETPAPPSGQNVPTPTTELTELDPMTGPAPETAPQVPGLELVAMRKEEPTDAVPITYREYSFALAAGAEPHDLERRARAAWEQVRDAIQHRTSQKFVQIALFDHRFEGRPSRPPLAVLAWKDWRGDPVVQIRGATAPTIAPASSASILPRPAAPENAPAAAKTSAPVPAAAVAELPTAPPVAGAPPRVSTVPSFPAPQAILSSPAPARKPAVASQPVPGPHAEAAASQQEAATHIVAPAPAAQSMPAAAPAVSEAPTTSSVAPAIHGAGGEPAAPAVAAPANAAVPASSFVEPREAPPSAEPKRTKTPSRPGAGPGRRRGSSEDLIGELFEEMHSLHFAPDIVSGADYVLNVVTRVLPSEGVLIHVFDINTRQFVVVRAAGPNARNVLLHRTPDTFKLFRTVLRRSRSLVVPDAASDQGFQSERWERLGVSVRTALCGAVKQGGRYLGFIELANPAGGAAFQDTDVNALDYICTQFADFVASRPIVLDEDAVLPKT
ncbi:MAG TPA: GAF domain-containing protein [Polyangiaceae bacterium]|nr:GAF domain-containing protein [Polyangiaceae bacterium]